MHVFQPRRVESRADWLDADGIKLYTISAENRTVDQAPYLARLQEIKRARKIPWDITPAFAIFHDAAQALYLVLGWWGNDNELFTSTSARTAEGWVEDPSRFSFCLWDLEVMWQERNYFVEHMYGRAPDLERYRAARFSHA
ncbi:MAG TPA: hypothetical protein VL997_07300 [Dyella sp.]|nr:hypothetical protein [Dyella sp.]